MGKIITLGKSKKRSISCCLFLITSLLVFYFFLKVPRLGDDINNWKHRYLYKTVILDIHYVVHQYSYWSSRTLINFVMYLFSSHARIWFVLVNTLFFFLLLVSLSKLFNPNGVVQYDLIICLVMLAMPFPYLSTAGWIATTTTYLWPSIIAIFAISILLRNRKLGIAKEFIICISLLYAANNEQIMIILLLMLTYLIATSIYYRKENGQRYYLPLIMVVFNFIYMIICPGNKVRSQAETIRWFPQFIHLSVLNKLDLGVMTTGENVLFGNIIAVLLFVSLLALFQRARKTNSFNYSVANLFLLLICYILFDVHNLTGKLSRLFTFPHLGIVKSFSWSALIQLLIYLLFAFLLVNSMKNVFDNKYLEAIVLVGAAFLSRVAIGFSPTVYASSTRTYFVLMMVLLILCIPLAIKLQKMSKAMALSSSLVVLMLSVVNIVIAFMQISGNTISWLLPLWVVVM